MTFMYHRTVHFRDTDAAGVVYFANVLSMCHEGFEASLETAGINIKAFFTHSVLALPIVHSSIDFLRPMYCGDKLAISLAPQKIGLDKLEISYEVSINEVLVAKAITRHVCIEVNTRTKQPLPQDIINWLETNRRKTEEVERRKSREEIV